MKKQKIFNGALVEIGKAELALNTMKKYLLEKFFKFLQIFEDATVYLQGRKYQHSIFRKNYKNYRRKFITC